MCMFFIQFIYTIFSITFSAQKILNVITITVFTQLLGKLKSRSMLSSLMSYNDLNFPIDRHFYEDERSKQMERKFELQSECRKVRKSIANLKKQEWYEQYQVNLF